MRSTCLLLCFLGLSAAVLPAETAIPKECEDALKDIRTKPADQRDLNIQASLKLKNMPTCFAQLFIESSPAASSGFADFVKRLEAIRTDKQAGAGAGAGGTTNLISKGTTAQVLSVATEYGALTESVNKTVVTVQGSLDGIPSALVRKNVIPYCLPTASQPKGCINQSLFDALHRFSYGVSFDTSQGNQAVSGTATAQPNGTAQPVEFTANSRQITAWNVRAVLWNARQDGLTKEFTARWQKLLDAARTAATAAATDTPPAASADAGAPDPKLMLEAAKALFKPMEALFAAVTIPEAKYQAWYKAAFAAMSTADTQTKGVLEAVWLEQINLYLALVAESSPKAVEAAQGFIRAMSQYEYEQRQFLVAIATKPVLTLQYNNNRPTGQSSTSTVRGILDKGFKHGISLAANGAFTVYNSDLPKDVPGVSRLRDAQFGAQIQKDLGNLGFLGAGALAGSYYFQYQNSPAILNVQPGTPLPGISIIGLPATATKVFAEKGNLHIGQLRLLLGAGGSSVRFPLAISYSNRTELITKPTWRAQIGVSYDFDALFAK